MVGQSETATLKTESKNNLNLCYMKFFLTLLITGISMLSFGQTVTKHKIVNEKNPATTEYVQCVRPAGGGDPVCTTVKNCGKVGGKTDSGGTITSCDKVKLVNTQLDTARGVNKKINSNSNNPQQKMMHCRKNSDGSLSDCYVESGKCSDVIWAEGFVCKDLMVEQVNNQSKQKKNN